MHTRERAAALICLQDFQYNDMSVYLSECCYSISKIYNESNIAAGCIINRLRSKIYCHQMQLYSYVTGFANICHAVTHKYKYPAVDLIIQPLASVNLYAYLQYATRYSGIYSTIRCYLNFLPFLTDFLQCSYSQLYIDCIDSIMDKSLYQLQSMNTASTSIGISGVVSNHGMVGSSDSKI